MRKKRIDGGHILSAFSARHRSTCAARIVHQNAMDTRILRSTPQRCFRPAGVPGQRNFFGIYSCMGTQNVCRSAGRKCPNAQRSQPVRLPGRVLPGKQPRKCCWEQPAVIRLHLSGIKRRSSPPGCKYLFHRPISLRGIPFNIQKLRHGRPALLERGHHPFHICPPFFRRARHQFLQSGHVRALHSRRSFLMIADHQNRRHRLLRIRQHQSHVKCRTAPFCTHRDPVKFTFCGALQGFCCIQQIRSCFEAIPWRAAEDVFFK